MTHLAEQEFLTAIVAVGLDGEIGFENGLPWKLKSDLQFFRQKTVGNLVIMGRKTYESLGRCLPSRENVVLSHRAVLFEPHDGCFHAHSTAETLVRCEQFPKKVPYVIGGAQTYETFADLVDRYLLTVVDCRFPHADARLPEGIFGDEGQWVSRTIASYEKSDFDECSFTIVEMTHREAGARRAMRERLVREYRAANHLDRAKIARRPAAKSSSVETLPAFL